MNNIGTKSIISEKTTGIIVAAFAILLLSVVTYYSFK